MLGISGFESSANFIEEQKDGVFPKTLRNMWIAVAIFNPLISLLSLGVLPIGEIEKVGLRRKLLGGGSTSTERSSPLVVASETRQRGERDILDPIGVGRNPRRGWLSAQLVSPSASSAASEAFEFAGWGSARESRAWTTPALPPTCSPE